MAPLAVGFIHLLVRGHDVGAHRNIKAIREGKESVAGGRMIKEGLKGMAREGN